MTINLHIREATTTDAVNISRLLVALSEKYIAFEFTPQGVDSLLTEMSPDAIENFIQSGYRYHVAELDENLAGVVAVRDNSHLYHLFVAEEYQRKGIARELWQVALGTCLTNGNVGEFTVNSSKFAVPVYEKLGFVVESGPAEKNGVVFIPMNLKICR
jgi:GNAT superfamily N-acetyltransferase